MSNPIHALLYRTTRGADRRQVERPSTMRNDDGAPLDVMIEDLSETGFRIRSDDVPEQDDAIMIGLAGLGVRSAVVVWQREESAGCAFDHPLSRAELEYTITADTLVRAEFGAAAMNAGPPVQRLRFRRRMGTIILAAIAAWGVFLAAAWVLIRVIAG